MSHRKVRDRMTREELRDYVDEQRSLDNIPYHVYSALIDGIDTLEQEPILDKIRAELHATAEFHDDGDCYLRDEWIDEIFDKYKAESKD
jgi:hypothetical protein